MEPTSAAASPAGPVGSEAVSLSEIMLTAEQARYLVPAIRSAAIASLLVPRDSSRLRDDICKANSHSAAGSQANHLLGHLRQGRRFYGFYFSTYVHSIPALPSILPPRKCNLAFGEQNPQFFTSRLNALAAVLMYKCYPSSESPGYSNPGTEHDCRFIASQRPHNPGNRKVNHSSQP
jgi:hypothetical protein